MFLFCAYFYELVIWAFLPNRKQPVLLEILDPPLVTVKNEYANIDLYVLMQRYIDKLYDIVIGHLSEMTKHH